MSRHRLLHWPGLARSCSLLRGESTRGNCFLPDAGRGRRKCVQSKAGHQARASGAASRNAAPCGERCIAPRSSAQTRRPCTRRPRTDQPRRLADRAGGDGDDSLPRDARLQHPRQPWEHRPAIASQPWAARTCRPCALQPPTRLLFAGRHVRVYPEYDMGPNRYGAAVGR